jgi:hypothetical protein
MTTLTKSLLAISVLSFAGSVTGAAWGIFLPFGAVFFGLFLISKVLENEVELFNEEQRQRLVLAGQCSPKNAGCCGCDCKETSSGKLTVAHSH